MEPRAEVGARLETAQLLVRACRNVSWTTSSASCWIAGHPVRQPEDGAAVALHERPEGFAISIAGQRDGGGVRLRHPSD